MQNVLWKIKSKCSPNECKQLYSSPGKFYGPTKIPKPSQVNHLAKHIAKLSSPVSTSEYAVKSVKGFMENIRTVKITKGYQMVSFDVKLYLPMCLWNILLILS